MFWIMIECWGSLPGNTFTLKIEQKSASPRFSQKTELQKGIGQILAKNRDFIWKPDTGNVLREPAREIQKKAPREEKKKKREAPKTKNEQK